MRHPILPTLVLLACCGAARAQAPDAVALRRALIEQAQGARQRDDHAEALRLAEAAGRIEMTPSLRLFITIEQFLLNRYVAAMGSADLCVREAGLRAVARREEIIASCASYIDRIRPLVGHLAVDVPDAPAGIEVRVNDLPVDASLLGFAVPVDPGAVRIAVRAPDRVPITREARVPAGETVREVLRLEPMPPPQEPAPPPAIVAPPPAIVAPPPPPPRSAWSRIGAGPPALFGAAAVFGALAGVFFAMRESSLDGCVVDDQAIVCADVSRQAQARDASTWNTLTNASLVAAGVAVVGAGVWLAVNLSRSAPHPMTAELRPGLGALDLRVRW